jgi:hypothetical protein
MQSISGRNGQRALALIIRLARLSAKEVDEVADAWRQGSALDRGRAAAPPALVPAPDRAPDDAADQWPAPYILR